MPTYKLLWIMAPSAEGKKQGSILNELVKTGFSPKNVVFTSPRQTNKFKDLWTQVKGVGVIKINKERMIEFNQWLTDFCLEKGITHICFNDIGCYNATHNTSYQTLNTHRGFTHLFNGYPSFTIDDYTKTYSKYHSDDIFVSAWIWKKDLAKLLRMCEGTAAKMPKFRYEVARNQEHLEQLVADAINSRATLSCDIETSSSFISCIGFGYLLPDGSYFSFVVPFIDNRGCYWGSEEKFVAAWKQVALLMDKAYGLIFHNGIYDLTYTMRYGGIPGGILHDTMYMWRSVWAHTPKTLAFCASILVDNSTFWKDEVKDERDSSQNKWAIPNTLNGMKNYWFYNAVDVYMTHLVADGLTKLLTSAKADWALSNYCKEMAVQWGPALMMNNLGLKVDYAEREKIIGDLRKEAADARIVLDAALGEDFNPNSPKHMQKVFYDFLGDYRPDKRGKPSADKTTMARVSEVSPLHEYFFKLVRDFKGAAANVSKYGDDLLLAENDRMVYQLNNAATWTGRFGARANAFDMGTNAQNIPKNMRKMFVADKGYVFLEADFSNSDTFFVAFESGDKKMMAMLTEGWDGHSLHAEAIFGIPYAEVKHGAATNKATNLPNDIKMKFIRDLTKKTTHGAAYLLGPNTMFNQIGRPTLIEAARIIGISKPDMMTNQQLVKFCGSLMDKYLARYPDVGVWKEKLQRQCVNQHLRSTAFGGLTTQFMASPINDHETYRALVAFHGQGGTAGNINRSMLEFYYGNNGFLPSEGVQLRLQVHDSLIFAIPEDKLHLASYCIDIMENEIELHGRKFHVPVAAALLYRWGGKEVDFLGFTAEKTVETYTNQLQLIKEKSHGFR